MNIKIKILYNILTFLSMFQIIGTNCNAFSIPVSRSTFIKGTSIVFNSVPFYDNSISNINNAESSESDSDDAVSIIDNDVYFCGELNDKNILKLRNTFLTAETNIEKAKKNRKEGLLLLQEIDNKTVISTPPVLPDHLNFFIQSPGGSFLSTLGLVDILINLKIPIYTYVNGYASSAATLLSIVGKKRYMYKNSVMLIHGIKLGNSNPVTVHDVQDVDYNVKIFMNIMKNLYLENTKLSKEKLDELLSRDIYLTAAEAYQYGLIDEII